MTSPTNEAIGRSWRARARAAVRQVRGRARPTRRNAALASVAVVLVVVAAVTAYVRQSGEGGARVVGFAETISADADPFSSAASSPTDPSADPGTPLGTPSSSASAAATVTGPASPTVGPSGTGRAGAGASLATPASSAHPSPTPSATRRATVPPMVAPTTGANAFGIAAGSTLPTLSPDELGRRLQGMAALGVGWVRFDIEWNNVQRTGSSSYEFANYDAVVKAIVAHGMRPLAILDYTPAWARAAECAGSPVCRPRSASEFGVFAGVVSARYAGMGLHTWEIWNEPNLTQFYAPRPDPAGYTALLRAAYSAIKAADPGATVITGGTAPTQTADDGSTIRSTDFLAGIYNAGGKGSFDAVSQHPYTFPYTPDSAYPGGAWGDLTALHAIMTSNGDGSKKVWSTEYGAPTGGSANEVTSDVRQVYPGGSHVSEALQATIVTNAVARIRSLPWAGPLFWYSYQDAGSDPSTLESFFGLLRADGSHKPAYDAYRSAIG